MRKFQILHPCLKVLSTVKRTVRALLILVGVIIAASCDRLPLVNDKPRTIALAGGEVVLAAPAGYCIDTGNSKDQGVQGGFALISSCRSLLGVAATPAIITVSVGPKVTVDQVSTAAFADALGNPAVIASEQSGMVSLLHIANGGAQTLPGGDDRYWRAIRVVSGRLVSMALYAPKGANEAQANGSIILKTLANNLYEPGPQV